MPPKQIQSLERAINVIQALTEERRALSPSEVSRLTGLAPATVQRILATLLANDWVAQDEAGFRPSVGLVGVGASAAFYNPLIERGQAMLTELAEFTGIHSYLCVLVGSRVCYLSRVAGRDGRPSRFRSGLLQRAQATASGKLLLAFLPARKRQRVLASAGPCPRYTPTTIVDPEAFAVELGKIEKLEYALDRGERTETFHALAVPIRSSDGRVIAALQIGSEPNVATDERLMDNLDHMRMLATELSLRLANRD